MRTLKVGLFGVAAAAVAAFAASLHGTKSAEGSAAAGSGQAQAVTTAPPLPEAPASSKVASVEVKAPEAPAVEAATAAPKAEPGAEPYAILPDGTRYYWVKGATKDASGNWVPHVFHVAAQPIELDEGREAPPAPSGSSTGSPR